MKRTKIRTVIRNFTWGLGGAADNLLYNGLNALIFPIFNLGLGVSAVLIGALSTVPRLLDAVSDPLMGYVSDKTRTRWGRRRPYILIGSLLAGLLFFLIFLPSRSWGETSVIVYYLPLLICFYLAYTVFMIPYTALGFELTTDPKERIKALAWRGYLGLAAGLSIPFLYKACFWFDDDEVTGVKYVAGIVGVIVFMLGAAVAFGTKEKEVIDSPKIRLLEALKLTFSNKSFLFITACQLTALFGIFIAMPLVVYINNFYVFSDDKQAAALWFGWYGSAKMIGGLLGAITVSHLPLSRFYKARFLLLAGFLSVAGSWWLFNPAIPQLQIIQGFVFGFSVNGLFLLCTSFVADICDIEAKSTGVSRQGFYAAAMEFAKKCAISLSTLFSGFMIAYAGVEGEITAEVHFKLRSSFIFVLGSSILISVICYLIFERMTRKDIEDLAS